MCSGKRQGMGRKGGAHVEGRERAVGEEGGDSGLQRAKPVGFCMLFMKNVESEFITHRRETCFYYYVKEVLKTRIDIH